MNKEEAGELLGKFWSEMPENADLDESIYLIDLFIKFLYKEGLEIVPIEFVDTESNVIDKEGK